MVPPSATRRDGGLDALRAAMTLLVVFHHAALTYGAIGGWYYREVPTDGRIATKLLILFCTVNQAWFMGLFFLIAGSLTPGAVQRHGAIGYLRERLRRLGIPLLAYIMVIGPMTIALAQTARGRPFLPTLLRIWERRVFDNGPLWFAQALLIFALGYLAWRAMAARSAARARAFPAMQTMIAAALVTGLAAFALRLVWRVGETIYGLQLAYFASYVALFAAGCAGAAGRWPEAIPDRQRRWWLAVALCALPVLPAVVMLAPKIPALQGDTSGGWNIQAAIYAFWEPPIAWGFSLALLHGFGRRFRKLGPAWSTLSRRVFAIYIIHPPVLVAVALAWRDVAAPQLVKFAITGGAACLICYVVAGLLLRPAWVRRIV